ncbi:RlpA-like double-psi beta-barrel-protein domain-containing protein-containing protein [Xylariaceae sp. FL0804]|nr:RlpA-like double-psi beta-barrel-protein domain-containing protein-containing protein [Xylariaceae sp. FL0804]
MASPTSRRSESSSSAINGTSTFYGGNLQGGMCSFSTYTLPSGIYGTAFSGSSWDSAAHCGACMEVTANGKTITAMVVDQCPECDEGHLDLFEDAFDALSPSSSDPLATSYVFVDCPDDTTTSSGGGGGGGVSGPLVLHSKSGASAYWFSMQVVNARAPVAGLAVSTDGGDGDSWRDLAALRTEYNFFEYASGFGAGAVAVKVTSDAGEVVVVEDVVVASDAQVTAGSNF